MIVRKYTQVHKCMYFYLSTCCCVIARENQSKKVIVTRRAHSFGWNVTKIILVSDSILCSMEVNLKILYFLQWRNCCYLPFGYCLILAVNNHLVKMKTAKKLTLVLINGPMRTLLLYRKRHNYKTMYPKYWG